MQRLRLQHIVMVLGLLACLASGWLLGSDQQNLTQNSHRDGFAEWSPDGTQIAFASGQRAPDVFVMNADGSDKRQLTDLSTTEYLPSWSPDGRRIIFTSERADDRNRELYVMNADGSGQEILLEMELE